MLSGATERNTLQSDGETVPTPVHRPTELEPYVFQGRGTLVRCSLMADRSRRLSRALRPSARLAGEAPGSRPVRTGALARMAPPIPAGYPGSPLRLRTRGHAGGRGPGAPDPAGCRPDGIHQTNSVHSGCRRTMPDPSPRLTRSLHKQSLRSQSSHPPSGLLATGRSGTVTGSPVRLERVRCPAGRNSAIGLGKPPQEASRAV
jgi:hypothetical protein